MNDVTMVTVSFNAADALALMWESFLKFHERPRWLVFDNGSTDGALEYAKEYADIVLEGDNGMSHGERISQLVELVKTPFLLHVDNDIEFHGDVSGMLRKPFGESRKTYCSCLTRLFYPVNEWAPPREHAQKYPYGTFDVYGKIWKGMWSPNIAVGMMKTKVIKRVLDLGIGFGYYACDKRNEWWETGGMAYLFAKAMGYECAELPDLWERVEHHGSISTYFTGAHEDPVIAARWKNVQERLVEFRAQNAHF